MIKKKEEEIFKHLMKQYKDYWDRNQYNRTNYDEDLEYYLGYRNQAKYPLAYNEVFNRILPIIYTLLSKFMDQLYQGGNVVSVRPRKSQDVERAKKVESVLNFQLESLNDVDMQGGSYLTMMKWFFNAITFGKGIAKVYWRKEERIGPKREQLPTPQFDAAGNIVGMQMIDHITQETQVFYDGPYVEILHNKTFLPHPQYRSIQQMPACFLIYKRNMDYLKKMEDMGVYNNIKEVPWESTGGAGQYAQDSNEAFVTGLRIECGLHQEELNSDRITPEVDILECYTKMIFDDNAYEVGSGHKIKGREEEAIIHIANYKTIISLQKNTYGIRPLFDIGCYMHPEMYWDLGLVRLCKGLQEQINTLGNLRMQNVMMMINQMLRVDPESDIDPKALVWKPFGIVPAMKGEVEPLVVPDMSSNLFMEQENFYEHTIQDLTGQYSYNMGQMPQRQEKVGVVTSIQSMGEARAKLMLMSFDYLGIRPLLRYMMILNTFHLPSGFEFRIADRGDQEFGQIFGSDIHADFDFAARYSAMEPALSKGVRAQQLVQMAQLWGQHPWINQYQMLKTVMELMDVRESTLLLKNPQQMMKEMEQQQKQQMMAAQAQQQSQEKMEQVKAQGKMMVSEKDFVEDTALAEQDFQYNVVLEGMKGKEGE